MALRSETHMTGMKWRIWKAKCLLLKQIQQLDDTSLAKQVCGEADARGWPELQKEVKEIGSQIGIRDMNKHDVSNHKIKQAIYYSHYKSMKEELQRLSKLEHIQH